MNPIDTKSLNDKIIGLVPNVFFVDSANDSLPSSCSSGTWHKYVIYSSHSFIYPHGSSGFITIWAGGNPSDVMTTELRELMKSEGYSHFYHDLYVDGKYVLGNKTNET